MIRLLDKSIPIMLLNQVDWENPTIIVAKLNDVYFIYLPILIVPLFHNILHTNHRAVIRVVSNPLDRWTLVPMSIMGETYTESECIS